MDFPGWPVSAPASPPVDPGKVEEITRQVLERPEFQDIALPDPWRLRPPEISSDVAWVLLVVAGVLLAVALVFLVRLSRKRLGTGAAPTRATAEHDRDSPVRTSADALQLATTHAARGDFREGMRLLHVATLLRLSEQRLLRFHDSMTSGECVRALKEDERRAAPYRRLATLCDGVVFGGAPATETEWLSGEAQFAECTRD